MLNALEPDCALANLVPETTANKANDHLMMQTKRITVD